MCYEFHFPNEVQSQVPIESEEYGKGGENLKRMIKVCLSLKDLEKKALFLFSDTLKDYLMPLSSHSHSSHRGSHQSGLC